MRTVIQRTARCEVRIDGESVGKIGRGMLVLLGIEAADTQDDIDWLCGKIARLRIFDDADGVMNLDVKGNRPSYIRSAPEPVSRPMYEKFVAALESMLGRKVATGRFGADMKVELVNDGPVTICIDTKNRE